MPGIDEKYKESASASKVQKNTSDTKYVQPVHLRKMSNSVSSDPSWVGVEFWVPNPYIHDICQIFYTSLFSSI